MKKEEIGQTPFKPAMEDKTIQQLQSELSALKEENDDLRNKLEGYIEHNTILSSECISLQSELSAAKERINKLMNPLTPKQHG